MTVLAESRISKSEPVHTSGALAALLPADVAARIDPDLLREPYTAPALRILATIGDERIWEYVGAYRIDWSGMRSVPGLSTSVAARIEMAAALSGWAMYSLDATNQAAVLDAVRIACEGFRS